MTGTRRQTFSLFGHSAGGQFVHRYMTFTESPRVDLALAAIPGWYTLPTFDEAFPYGLGETTVSTESPRALFAKPVVILLGEEDAGANLRMTVETVRQGRNRLARGKFYFATAKRQAEKLGAAFKWRLGTVPGVGHQNAGMAVVAAKSVHDMVTGAR